MKNEKEIDEILAEVKIRLMKKIKPVNGVWYKYANSELHKVRFTDIENHKGYGISTLEFKNSVWSIETLIPMTEPEILEMLKNHAIKLGFKSGVKVDRDKLNITSYNVLNIKTNNFDYYLTNDQLYLNNFLIYQQGIWADIVTEKTSNEWMKEYYESLDGLKEFTQKHNLELKQKK